MTSARSQFTLFSVILTLAVNASFSYGQSPVAGHDFDGGTTNGNLSAMTESFSPDYGGCNGVASSLFGSCDVSRFDRFGILNRDTLDDLGVEALPFDMVDETVLSGGRGVLTDDSVGILRSTKLDNVVGLVDTNNDVNMAPVNAAWTFDVSNATNLQMSIDFASLGDFEHDIDFFKFTYSIDGGATETAFDVRGDDDGSGFDSGVFYGVVMENGEQYDRTADPFFSEADWIDLTTNGPRTDDNEFHPDDVGTAGDTGADGIVNGADFLDLQRSGSAIDDWEANFGTVDGDRVAADGFIPVRGAFGLVDERALQDTNPNGTFDEVENNVLKDPLFVNGGEGVGTLLNNVFQTITVPIVGEGSTLTLNFEAVADGGSEYFVFDNILIEGDLVPGISAVPEPTSLALMALGFGLIASGLRRG